MSLLMSLQYLVTVSVCVCLWGKARKALRGRGFQSFKRNDLFLRVFLPLVKSSLGMRIGLRSSKASVTGRP
eukprot:5405363-Amphidinium_carterae.1